ncbi:hypothetical protein OHB12_04970 [Nocardia sp. NBC_01730]|uniref:hypothetical protein n=1 Tax=Nocardia sp. NBC_01730 TaxID=2975998 RepID=UPI002E162864|nr:hypothetical protein OHB12_04970 [Nocardia sp. NBC_01730]
MIRRTSYQLDSEDTPRQRATRKVQAARSVRHAVTKAEGDAAALVREAAAKFSPLSGLTLVVVRPRKLFDRGKPIVGEDNDHRGTYTAVDEMRCWFLLHSRNYGRVVLTEFRQAGKHVVAGDDIGVQIHLDNAIVDDPPETHRGCGSARAAPCARNGIRGCR